MAKQQKHARLRAFLQAHAAATGAVSLYAAALDVGRAQDVRASALVTFNGFLLAGIAVLSSAFFSTITSEALFALLLSACGVLTFFATTFALTAVGDWRPAGGPDIEAIEISRLAARITAYRVSFILSVLATGSLSAFVGALFGYGSVV